MRLNTFSNSKWSEIITFLGLEISKQIFDEIGLVVVDKDIFFRKLNKGLSEKSFFVTWEYTESGKAIILNEKNFSENAADYKALIKWLECTYILFASDNPETFLWKRLIRDADEINSKEKEPVYFKDLKTSQNFFLAYQQAQAEAKEAIAKIEAIDAKPLSNWDLNYFSIFEMTSLFDFYFIRWTVENFYFNKYVVSFLTKLSSVEREYFYSRIKHLHADYIRKNEDAALITPDKLNTC